mmetsp:Transcript_34832/g.75694  ORF Transcript_34832/g.75694 Transcript_34832/m.75694 type:complete len:722 (-) Transcript_34832:66-2231(-)
MAAIDNENTGMAEKLRLEVKNASGMESAPTTARSSSDNMESCKPASLEGYGDKVFWGAAAEPYLVRQGLSAADLESPLWTRDAAKADKVAAAVLQFAIARGASSFCHLFQPMAATYRHGQAGCVQLAMFEFDKNMQPKWELKGKDLLQGETDGSSYPNGGMRATHTAGGYLCIDAASPMYVRDDVLYVPAAFVAYTGKALDEKIPLHRACEALSREGAKLFKLCGYEIKSMTVNVGLEQEFFILPRDAYYRRPDLQFAGRTVMGKMPGRGQEGCDHYMAPIKNNTAALAAIKEIQQECFKLGIPLKTRHREVAPNQYEMAPLFGDVRVKADQNLLLMQIADEVCTKHGLAAVFVEKPFAGINGSGKHNNWSICTDTGVNLFNPEQLTKASGNAKTFPIVMAAVVAAIDKYGDMMRMAVACPGNDFRLGAMEAPPAVISTYLGEQMTQFLTKFIEDDSTVYEPSCTPIDMGCSSLPGVVAPAEDRNRTSPFPYGGHRFEFRAAGSSQNVSWLNTVLATMVAHEFAGISAKVEAGETASDVAKALLKTHMKVVFNGNGYDEAWPSRAEKIGLFNIPSGVEAIKRLSVEKNTELFSSMGVLTVEETEARKEILLEHYIGVVEMEVLTMADMISQHVAPSGMSARLNVDSVLAGAEKILAALKAVHDEKNLDEGASLARTLRLETMVEVRKLCDDLEAKVPADQWSLATYKELLFMDMNKSSPVV